MVRSQHRSHSSGGQKTTSEREHRDGSSRFTSDSVSLFRGHLVQGLVVLATSSGTRAHMLIHPLRPQGPVSLVIIFSCSVQYQWDRVLWKGLTVSCGAHSELRSPRAVLNFARTPQGMASLTYSAGALGDGSQRFCNVCVASLID